ncbi:hypothetical protein AGMMS50267_06870 [Spirochaetia bacterium]|nr:hypothetical protein AGMMS50267_06870 [Spirochaetia bacterium]
MKNVFKMSIVLAVLVTLFTGCPKTTGDDDITAPAEVGSLRAVAGTSQVLLVWTEPADSDFAKVVITYTNGTAQIAISVPVAKGTKTRTITGLTNDKAYTFTVQTVDVTGNTSAGKTATATPTLSAGVAAPTATPGAGAYTVPQTVTLTTAMAEADIYYTLDGATPTTSSTPYTAPFTVSVGTTLKAIAVKAGMPSSAVLTAEYTNVGSVAAPTSSPEAGTYTEPQTVTLASITAGADIYYTINGTTPTTSSTRYTTPFTVSMGTTLKAIAVKAGMTDSAVMTAAYTQAGWVATPIVSPGPGTYAGPQTVTLGTTTALADIYYTLDNTTPTASSTHYTTAITVNMGTTLKAIAVRAGMTDSEVLQAAYTQALSVATPTASPRAGGISATQTITLTSTIEGAAIRYTTDGTTPTASNGTVYSGAFTLASLPATVTAIAYKVGLTDSEVLAAAYTLALPVAPPRASPLAGIISVGQTITLTSATAGATIRYTTDGTTPTASTGTEYSAPFALAGFPATVKAIAYKVGMTDSAVLEAAYTAGPQAAAPTASPAAGAIGTVQTITLASTTPGAIIYYTTDGTTPTASTGTEYRTPFTLASLPATVTAIAYKDGITDSAVLVAAYTQAQVAAPTVSPGTGIISREQIITLSCTTARALIYYTTTGVTPTASNGTLYSGTFRLSAFPATLKAIAYAAGMTDSEVVEVAYTTDTPNPPGTNYSFTTPADYRTMVSLDGGSITTTNGTWIFLVGRTVDISPFTMAKYETTYQLWKEVYDWAVSSDRGTAQYTFANPGWEGHEMAGRTPGTGTTNESHGWTAAQKASRPVTFITWRDAIVWCNAYSEISGLTPAYYLAGTTNFSDRSKVLRVSTNNTSGVETAADTVVVNANATGYRLPTEAEWEYAARGGNQGNATNWGYTYAGSGTVGDVAWYNPNSYDLTDTNKDWGVHPVGTKPANLAGLFDMSGNVGEFCYDWYESSINTGTVTNPAGPAAGTFRVGRGGTWHSDETSCTVYYRDYFRPWYRIETVGFRLVRRAQ